MKPIALSKNNDSTIHQIKVYFLMTMLLGYQTITLTEQSLSISPGCSSASLHPALPHRLDERLISKEEILELLAESQKSEELNEEDLSEIRSTNPKKSWTIMVYMAADNDLHYFAWKNLKQMEQIGSNEHITILVQLNTPGLLNPTKRFIVKKGRRLLVQDEHSPQQKLNSGNPYTLIDFVRWGVEHYPADEYAFFAWNHGSAAIDPNFSRTINPCDLFYLNPSNNRLEIDRGISYMTLLSQVATHYSSNIGKRGICFDESFKSYISNPDLDFALHEIYTKVLNGKKFGLIAFDACLMSMIEIASIAKKYSKYMASSQEVEYGTGLNYDLTLRPFLSKNLTAKEFAQQIVIAYEQTYQKIINDYTYSALDLSSCEALEHNINIVARLLHEALLHQHNYSMSDIIRKCKSTQYCTCFDEPSYIDLAHFYNNLLQHLQHINLQNKYQEGEIQKQLQACLQQGLDIISNMVIENRVGQKLRKAQGVSIYFPEHSIAHNYLKSPFAISNNWSFLLAKYILG